MVTKTTTLSLRDSLESEAFSPMWEEKVPAGSPPVFTVAVDGVTIYCGTDAAEADRVYKIAADAMRTGAPIDSARFRTPE